MNAGFLINNIFWEGMLLYLYYTHDMREPYSYKVVAVANKYSPFDLLPTHLVGC